MYWAFKSFYPEKCWLLELEREKQKVNLYISQLDD